MSTARSSAEPAVPPDHRPGGPVRQSLRATSDVWPLLAFRLAGRRGRARLAAPVAVGVLGALTLTAVLLPALVPVGDAVRHQVSAMLSTAYLGVLLVSVVSAVASGGGRELLPVHQAVAFPVSPTTDHLGALLMAPLNIAWLVQGWTVLAATSLVAGPGAGQVLAALLVLSWLVTATALAQALAWGVEWVRRGPHGPFLVRVATAVLVAAATVAVVGGGRRLDALPQHSPAAAVAEGVRDASAGRWEPWSGVLAGVLLAGLVAVIVGGWMANRVARRPARDELRIESSSHSARAHPGSDLAALMRTDRAAIWRSVPMRRGMALLCVLPGAVAVAGSFGWDTMGIFPGLVASGGALLFGVNSWCLDGRGALWRESLPVSPTLVFASRALVLSEILLAASVGTLLLACLRAGLPTLSETVAVASAVVVVTVHVVATALAWSVRNPHAVDLRSARATPAPPLVMVGYSARLALGTTVIGLMFDVTSQTGWQWSLVVAAPFLAWSAGRLARTARDWRDPATRARVVTTVAA